MAYTTLPTQSAGQTASAAGWANLVKGNFDSAEHVIARKSADESVTNNTLQNDDHLFFSVGISQVWYLRLVLWLVDNSGGVADFRGFVTAPAGTTSLLSAVCFDASGNITNVSFSEVASQAMSVTPNAGQVIEYLGQVVTGGTAGTWQFQWAQNTTNGSSVIVKKGSFLSGYQIT